MAKVTNMSYSYFFKNMNQNQGEQCNYEIISKPVYFGRSNKECIINYLEFYEIHRVIVRFRPYD